jgi:hypothetical protein
MCGEDKRQGAARQDGAAATSQLARGESQVISLLPFTGHGATPVAEQVTSPRSDEQ